VLSVIEAFTAAHKLPDVAVVADAGMISEANQKAIEAAGLSFILYPVLARPAAPGLARLKTQEITKPGLTAAAVDRQAKSVGPVCIRSACRCSVQQ
jgi:hypothetical protein